MEKLNEGNGGKTEKIIGILKYLRNSIGNIVKKILDNTILSITEQEAKDIGFDIKKGDYIFR